MSNRSQRSILPTPSEIRLELALRVREARILRRLLALSEDAQDSLGEFAKAGPGPVRILPERSAAAPTDGTPRPT